MNTPISDFVRSYAASKALRLHMPGHKGKGPLGVEERDITEIGGADVLYQSEGIIRQSEDNAARLFGAGRTLYSTEGSSLCIRAMIYLAMLHARAAGRTPKIAAGRNAHKTFLTACALLDTEVEWLYPETAALLSCPVTPEQVEAAVKGPQGATAVFVTSPDYLGHQTDIAALAVVCRRYGALLLVDNAHGAYLRFLTPSRHPMDLGADLCCDSAHKTLPVLTGGAYLHISDTAPKDLPPQAESALSLFASTSPSYLILQSLDEANPYLAGDFPSLLPPLCRRVEALKASLTAQGWTLTGEEPLKLTLAPKACGYRGTEVAGYLEEQDIICEFADPDFLVLMFTPQLPDGAFDKLEKALLSLPRREAITEPSPHLTRPRRVCSPREALLAPREILPLEQCRGRVLAAPTVSCPPAVPVLICGEEVDEAAIRCFRYYGMDRCTVVRPL